MVCDPLTVSGALLGLVGTSAKTIKTCQDLAVSFRNAPQSLDAIRAECSAIKSGLSFIYGVISLDSKILAAGFMAGSPLAESFDVTLTACAVTFSRLDYALQELLQSAGHGNWRDRMRFVWQESTMKSLLEQMRGIRSAVTTILSAIQMDNLNTMLDLLTAKESVMVSLRQNLRSSKTPPLNAETISIFSHSEGDKEFDFDDEVVNSTVYRKVLQQMKHQDSPRQSTEDTSPIKHPLTTDLEENLIMLNDDEDTVPDVPPLTPIGTRNSALDDLIELSEYDPGKVEVTGGAMKEHWGTRQTTDGTLDPALSTVLSARASSSIKITDSQTPAKRNSGMDQSTEYFVDSDSTPDTEPQLHSKSNPNGKANFEQHAIVDNLESSFSPSLPFRTNTGSDSMQSFRTLPPRYSFEVEQCKEGTRRRRSSQIGPPPRRESTSFEPNLNLAGGGFWMTWMKDVSPSSFNFRGIRTSNVTTSMPKTFLTIPLIGDSGAQCKDAVTRWAQRKVSPSVKFARNDDLVIENSTIGEEERRIPLSITISYISEKHMTRLHKIRPGEAPFALICFAIPNLNSLENISKKWVPLIRNISPKMSVILLGLGPSAGLIRPGSAEPKVVNYDAIPDIPNFQALRAKSFLPMCTRSIGISVARSVGADAYFECSELSVGDLDRVFVTLLGVAAAVQTGS